MTDSLDSFLSMFTDSYRNGEIIKLTLSKRLGKAVELKNVFVKPVTIKSTILLSFVYRYSTKDITKNYSLDESLMILRDLLGNCFLKADLFGVKNDFHWLRSRGGNSKITKKPPSLSAATTIQHNREKKRFIEPENNVYLHELGVTTAEGKVKADKQDKFRQINKYIEIMESIVRTASFCSPIRIADMGSGKGYLTFSLYDYLTNALNLQSELIGVEYRKDLVDNCNRIASQAGFTHLTFKTGSIEATDMGAIDILIALHACDTATDQAIYKGIIHDAKVIICAPCCHKQIRKQMHPENDLRLISKYGILEERLSEIVTDTMRALIMQAYGYRTNVFEFISTEHTPKNLMITGIKSGIEPKEKKEKLEQLHSLKTMFGVEYHQLEKLLKLV